MALAARARHMSQTLTEVAGPGLEVSLQMDILGSFAASVGADEIKKLAASNRVAYIQPDHRYELFTKQGLSLMKAASLQSTSGGEGVSVAIVDTGINYNHVALGGGGFPNKKVIGGYDFAGVMDLSDPRNPKPRPDADPLDPPSQSHGSWCASIAAGSLMPHGNYAGGVAPGAKLYALKVFADNFPYTYESLQLKAYEWILKNQYKDPGNPIMIVSMSLGGPMRDKSKWPENNYCTSPATSLALEKLNKAGNHSVRGLGQRSDVQQGRSPILPKAKHCGWCGFGCGPGQACRLRSPRHLHKAAPTKSQVRQKQTHVFHPPGGKPAGRCILLFQQLQDPGYSGSGRRRHLPRLQGTQ